MQKDNNEPYHLKEEQTATCGGVIVNSVLLQGRPTQGESATTPPLIVLSTGYLFLYSAIQSQGIPTTIGEISDQLMILFPSLAKLAHSFLCVDITVMTVPIHLNPKKELGLVNGFATNSGALRVPFPKWGANILEGNRSNSLSLTVNEQIARDAQVGCHGLADCLSMTLPPATGSRSIQVVSRFSCLPHSFLLIADIHTMYPLFRC